jgi:hypothetical protein
MYTCARKEFNFIGKSEFFKNLASHRKGIKLAKRRPRKPLPFSKERRKRQDKQHRPK